MHRKCKIAFALAAALAGPGWASAQTFSPAPSPFTQAAPADTTKTGVPRLTFGAPVVEVTPAITQVPTQAPAKPLPGGQTPTPGGDPPETRTPAIMEAAGRGLFVPLHRSRRQRHRPGDEPLR